MSRLPELLASLRAGEVKVTGGVVHVKRRVAEDRWEPPATMYGRWRDRHSMMIEFGVDATSFALTGYESIANTTSREFMRRRLDGALRSSRPPWDGIEDLRRFFIGQPGDRPTRRDLSDLEVIAPLGARLGPGTSATRRRLNTEVDLARMCDPRHVTVAVVSPAEDTVARHLWTPRGRRLPPGGALLTKSFGLPKSYRWASCILTYRGIEADRLDLLGEGAIEHKPRWAAFQELAGEIEALADVPHGRPLEAHTEVMLHVFGFATAHYGGRDWRPGLTTPDVLAFPPEGRWFLAVECTEREPDLSNKLTKLATRTKELSRAVAGHHVYPVIVTALERSLVNPSDIDKASKEGISLLTVSDFPNLVAAAVAGRSPSQLRDFLEGFVPRGPEGRQPRWQRD